MKKKYFSFSLCHEMRQPTATFALEINKNKRVMKAKKLFFMECRVAGRQYHDADEVWDELKVGTQLRLVRDLDNRHDPNAVAMVLDKDGEEYLIGYVPRIANENLAALLEMGWTDIFECRICKVDPDTHYENQLHVSIRIKRREN